MSKTVTLKSVESILTSSEITRSLAKPCLGPKPTQGKSLGGTNHNILNTFKMYLASTFFLVWAYLTEFEQNFVLKKGP